ncbi:hypothetical protein HDU98_002634, partial [Podochytrium sp. JEL0797]
MHLMYYPGPNGKRIYTLKKTSPEGKVTLSAHPARFSPDDKFSRHRVTLKKRFGLLTPLAPPTALKNIAATSLLNASLGVETTPRAVSLVSPHPGATSVLEDAASWAAGEMRAGFVALDYLQIVKEVEDVKRRDAQQANEAESSRQTPAVVVQPSAITLSKPFTPSNFTPLKDATQRSNESPFDDDFEDDEEFDEDEDEPSGRHSGAANARALFGGLIRAEGTGNGGVQHHHHHWNQTFPVTVKVVVDGKEEVVRVEGKGEEGKNVDSLLATENAQTAKVNSNSPSPSPPPPFSSSGRSGRVRVHVERPVVDSKTNVSSGVADIWDPRNFSRPDANFYHVDLRARHVDMAMRGVLERVVDQAKGEEDGEKRRVVLFYRDVTDTLESGGESGKRVLAGLLNVVGRARREYGVPVVLVVACCPSTGLSGPRVVESGVAVGEAGRFEVFDSMQFSRLFSERVVLREEGGGGEEEGFSLGQSTRLYQSVLDKMPHLFDKIEVPPLFVEGAPVPVEAEASAVVAEGSEGQGVGSLEISADYLARLGEDMTRRNIEVNWRQILVHCASRRVVMRVEVEDLYPEEEGVVTDRARMPGELRTLAGVLLGHSVWSLERVRRCVGVALGLQLLAGGGRTGGGVEVGVKHFVEALKVVKEEVWGVRVEKAVREAEGKVVVVGGGKGKEVGDVRDDSESGGKGGGVAAVVVKEGAVAAGTAVKPVTVAAPMAPAVAVVESTETTTHRLKQSLKAQGHKLNSYETKMLSTVVTPASISVSFADLVLPPPTKLMLQTIVSLPLLRPDLFESGILAKHSIAGVLLFGPPGTGKTLLAKAAAKSSGANFMAVSLSDIFDKYVGEGEKNVRAVFTLARKLSPCVVFLDEVDALFGARRGGDGVTSSKREIINEFMSEWDGLNSRNRGVIVLGATNRPFDLDDAILRRMPRRVLVDLPTEKQRLQILQVHLKDEHLDASVDLSALAAKTVLYSGSDLKNVCISAALASVKEHILRESMPLQGVDGTGELVEASGEILKRLEGVEDWKAVMAGSGVSSPREVGGVVSPVKRVLTGAHFEVALKEVPPSLTDEMQTLVELRKWDGMY